MSVGVIAYVLNQMLVSTTLPEVVFHHYNQPVFQRLPGLHKPLYKTLDLLFYQGLRYPLVVGNIHMVCQLQ